jgi:hypothetical protein
VDQACFSQVPFPVRAFLGQDMIRKCLSANNLAGARGPEPFGRTTIGFYLWHTLLSILNWKLAGARISFLDGHWVLVQAHSVFPNPISHIPHLKSAAKRRKRIPGA